MTTTTIRSISAQASRAFASRAESLTVLEDRLAGSRRRLGRVEERLSRTADRTAPVTFGFHLMSLFRLPPVAEGYFEPGSHAHEDDWWSQQLGKAPRSAA